MAPSVAWKPTSAVSDGGFCPAATPTLGFHPVTAPDSEAKMKKDLPLLVPSVMTKSLVPLNTCPVGAPPGMSTLNGALSALPETSPVYTSLRSPPLEETQNDCGPTATPQPLTRVGSVTSATPGWSDTRLWTRN